MTNLVVSAIPRSQSPTGNALSKAPPSKFTPEPQSRAFPVSGWKRDFKATLRLAATISAIRRLIGMRTLTKYGVAMIADLFVKAIACPLHPR